MKLESNSAALRMSEVVPAHHFGLKAIVLEPLLIVGSFILWLAVLPVAGMFRSGVALLKLIGIHVW